MKFSMIASGSSGNCCIVEENNTKIMIDCGTTKQYFMQSLETLRIDLQDFNALLLTHGHNDHVARIKTMKQVESYGTFEIDKMGHHMISTHDSFVIGDLRITSIPLSHDFPKTIGYLVESEFEKLVYITDTGYINERYYDTIKDADYYVFESNHDPKLLMNTARPYITKQRILSSEGHLSNEESASMLTSLLGDSTQQIVLAHLSREANDESLALDTLYKVLQSTKIKTADKRIQVARQYELLFGGHR